MAQEPMAKWRYNEAPDSEATKNRLRARLDKLLEEAGEIEQRLACR